jgi:hypothetical protein
MNSMHRITLGIALAAVAALGFAAARLWASAEQRPREPATAPARTGPVRGLVLARPFVLEEPYVHAWRREGPSVRTGWLVVLEVDPSFVRPTQLAMPVLMVGDQTVECVNFGAESGRVIGVVPAPTDERGRPVLDLAASPVWFAAPELPERVDARWIAVQRAAARAEDLVTFTAGEIAAAEQRAGTLLAVASRIELDREAALLILRHAPAEHQTAEALLVPVTK